MLKRKANILAVLILLIAVIITVVTIILSINKEPSLSVKTLMNQGKWIETVELDKARYMPGEPVTLSITIKNDEKNSIDGSLLVRIKYLHDVIKEKLLPVKLAGLDRKTIEWQWEGSQKDFTGYGVEAWLLKDGKAFDMGTTAIDVSSHWGRFPRYGYLVDFQALSSKEIKERIAWLNRYHIDGLQYYDWQWKHHQPLYEVGGKVQEKWKDITNRDILLSTVKGYLDTAHRYGMVNMNYNLLFGAYQSSEGDGIRKEWGLYKDPKHSIAEGHPLPHSWATPKILLMNPNDPGWMEHIIQEEKKVFQTLPFDGWHVDQLGDRGRLYDYEGNIVRLEDTYAPFLNRVKQALNIPLVINAVNQYGQMQIAKEAPVDFLYTEIWPSSFNTYGHLKQVIDMNQNLSQGKLNTVLAAYMNYKLADREGEFNTPGVLLADSVIFASGGAHLELGDTGMLSREYFPHKLLTMNEDLKRELLHYYNFLVAYENLLRDQVTATDLIASSVDIPLSDQFQTGNVWYFAKERPGYTILHLLNFIDQPERLWRDDQGNAKEPKALKKFPVKVYLSGKVKGVYLASPNIGNGISESIQFERGKDDGGEYIRFLVPLLQYWDMIYFEKE